MEAKVLDKGYVRLIESFGDDLKIVNAAKSSYARRSEELGGKEIGILEFLAFMQHDSPIRHTALTFEVKAPLMVARQWYKYVVSSVHTEEQHGWNESSRRYVTDEPEFYLPSEFRGAPANKKQGSDDPVDFHTNVKHRVNLQAVQEASLHFYNEAMEDGICAEEARLYLSAYGLYINWQWTCSLQSAIHFLLQRLDSHAQWEIRQYATEVESMVAHSFPKTHAFFYEAGLIRQKAAEDEYEKRKTERQPVS